MTDSDGSGDPKRHPIEVAARRSGLTKDLLRAWERRYGAVTPGRTGSGRRLYSDHDVHRLTLLARATAGGRAISMVAASSNDELEAMVREDVALGPTGAAVPSLHPSQAAGHVRACLSAIHATDQDRLRRSMRRAAIVLPPVTLIEEVVAPLMRQVGDLWREQALDPGQERLASHAAREVLTELMEGLQDGASSTTRLLAATPSRQRHELGAMLAAATGSSMGWRVTYLGSDLPVEHIARAAEAVSAKAVALSLVFPDDDSEMPNDLRRLRRHLPDVAIVVGGRAAPAYSQALSEIGASVVEDLPQFRAELLRLAPSGGLVRSPT